MKTFLLLLALWVSSTASFAQWAITNVKPLALDKESRDAMKPKAMSKQTNDVPEDFFLAVTLRNESSDTVYVQGIRSGWYMVEAFIKNPKGVVWERQGTWVDQKLEMLPVKSGAEITVVRRESAKHIGCAMMLTFLMAHSEYDDRGSQILVGEFRIPSPPKSEPDSPANGNQPVRSETNQTSPAVVPRR